MSAGGPDVAVIYPLIDSRGPAADRVRTWACGQTLDRRRYRVVVATNGLQPDDEREVAALLAPHDRIVRTRGTSDAALWNAGAAEADTPWLVFTEAHCVAYPDTLACVAAWIDGAPGDAVANFVIDHDHGRRTARVNERWFGDVQRAWREPTTWRRVHRSGFAIPADVFKAAGGFDEATLHFGPTQLSAVLDERGVPMALIDARVTHLDDQLFRQGYVDTAMHGWGEVVARREAEPVRFERYFGHSDTWANHVSFERPVARAMVAGALRAARATRRWPVGVAPLAAQAVAGPRGRQRLLRAVVRTADTLLDRVPLPERIEWRLYLDGHRRAATLGELDSVLTHADVAPVLRSPGAWSVVDLVPRHLVGVHGLEQHDEGPFRWTKPISLVRVDPPPGSVVRIDTGAVRGDPAASVLAVPGADVGSDGRWLTIRPRRPFPSGIVVVVDAMQPSRSGSPDPRRLGLPVFRVEVVADG